MGDSASDGAIEALPKELATLLGTRDTASREQAWAAFVDTHSRLMLHVARSLGRDYDAVMDRYTYCLEQLRQDDFRRLRSYVPDGSSKFSTWLAVVVRRLCLDHYRRRYGRVRAAVSADTPEHDAFATRRRLADLVVRQIDLSNVGSSSADNPETELRALELRSALEAALRDLVPRDRLLLTLRFEDSLSAREIAEVMDYPTQFHVYRRLKALFGTLRRALGRRGIDESLP
ncbi:MAG: RNA polymerase sigma factor [Gemmatimonadales bacterium]